ncbi:MAG TPA: hypothetical protein VGQ83_27785 [Polyangia bacterium]
MTDNERARFEVLLEDIQVQVGVMAEGHTMLVAGQAELRAEVANLARSQVEVQAGLAVLRADVAGLKTDVAELKQGQADIRADVHDLRVSLEPRVARIERHLGLEGPERRRARRPAAKR